MKYDPTKPTGRRVPDREWYKTKPDGYDGLPRQMKIEWRTGNQEYRNRRLTERHQQRFDRAYQKRLGTFTGDPFAGL